MPVSLMLGNHDNRENFLKVFPDTPTTAEGHIQQVLLYYTEVYNSDVWSCIDV